MSDGITGSGRGRPIKVFVQQPYFLPWVGFWNKYLVSDIYVAFAGVQYGPRQFVKRVLLEESWFGLPISGYHRGQLLSEARFDLSALPEAARRLRLTLRGKRFPYADRVGPVIKALESYRGSPRLVDVNLQLIEIIRELLELESKPLLLDEDPRPGMTGTQRVCAAAILGAGDNRPIVYLSGALGVDYLTPEQVPEDMQIQVQEVLESAPRGTILEVLAQDEDPARVIAECARWHPLATALDAYQASKNNLGGKTV